MRRREGRTGGVDAEHEVCVGGVVGWHGGQAKAKVLAPGTERLVKTEHEEVGLLVDAGEALNDVNDCADVGDAEIEVGPADQRSYGCCPEEKKRGGVTGRVPRRA